MVKAAASDLLDMFKICMDSLCKKKKILNVSMHVPNVNKSFLPFPNVEKKNSVLSFGS